MKPENTPSIDQPSASPLDRNSGDTSSQLLEIKKILVPTDFSEPAADSARKALALANRFGAEITLLHVIEPASYADIVVSPFSVYELPADIPAPLQLELEKLAQGEPGKVRHAVRLGRAWQEIVELAKEDKSDLIVIATHGFTGLLHTLLGSVAEKVVRHAPCPVLVLRTPKTN